MRRESVGLVHQSWRKVQEIGPPAAALFYRNLFAANPELRGIFKGDMDQQGWKLLQMLGLAVVMLDEPDTLVPMLEQLAVRHVRYGVVEPHYAEVGQALLDALREGLGEEFTPEVNAAWTEAYGYLAQVMTSAAARAA